MLSAFMLSAFMLIAFMLIAFMLSAFMLSAFMLIAFMQIAFMLSAFMLIAFMLSAFMLSVMLNVIMLNVIMLNVIMLSVILRNVVAPPNQLLVCHKKNCLQQSFNQEKKFYNIDRIQCYKYSLIFCLKKIHFRLFIAWPCILKTVMGSTWEGSGLSRHPNIHFKIGYMNF
jgi:hypothetical protein